MRCMILKSMLFMLMAPSALCAESLTLATVEWPPFYGHNLHQKGYVYAVSKEAFRRAGYDITVVFLPWKRALELTRMGKYDGLLGVYYTESRVSDFVFSDTILKTREVFYFRSSKHNNYQSLQDLRGKVIGGLRGTAPLEDLKDYKLDIIINDITDEERGILQLHAKRIDLMLINIERFNYLMASSPSILAIKDNLKLSQLDFDTYSLHCAILRLKENSKSIIKRYNKELKK
ncbi:substrate-binding periplasmic protein [Vibrio sp. SCSIO 43137]|uniref:substrate-binding periplasmic protein n=1 Tax=Vibrio sp. SCSIO 43137 TaxID=3021011 RepID=UPI0023071C71|nr:transporter substrate-binding domain-containing protein [Vibrio sp. SCSIO 43137]WCE31435.1 transporter substrate-binding domain-containing protein [Vibrio sp. SCSIO 43137]